MSIRYYLKEVPASPLIVKGAPVRFDLHGTEGYRSLDPENPNDAELITALDQCIAERRGGIVPITEEQFTQKKNLPPAPKSPRNSPWDQAPRPLPRPPASRALAAGAQAAEAVKKQIAQQVDQHLTSLGLRSHSPLARPVTPPEGPVVDAPVPTGNVSTPPTEPIQAPVVKAPSVIAPPKAKRVAKQEIPAGLPAQEPSYPDPLSVTS